MHCVTAGDSSALLNSLLSAISKTIKTSGCKLANEFVIGEKQMHQHAGYMHCTICHPMHSMPLKEQYCAYPDQMLTNQQDIRFTLFCIRNLAACNQSVMIAGFYTTLKSMQPASAAYLKKQITTAPGMAACKFKLV